MVLSTHVITGGAVATLAPGNPALGFILGFASHFLLDSIPHWDYVLASKKTSGNDPLDTSMDMGKDFIRDLFVMGFDFLIGMIVVYSLLYSDSLRFTLMAGIIGGVLPDFLQFMYFRSLQALLFNLS